MDDVDAHDRLTARLGTGWDEGVTRTDRPELDVDLFDEAVLREPHATHDAVREAGPVVWLPSRGVWATGRDAEIREVLTDPARFSSEAGVGLANIRHEGSWQKPSVILEVDPPAHTVTRRVLNRVLSPSAMRALRDDFQRAADRLVGQLVERTEFDAVTDLAFRFPFTVLPDAVGLRVEGREHLVSYSTMYFNARVPGSRLAIESAETAEAAGSLPWIREQCRRDRLAPGKFGAQIYAAVDSGDIDEDTAGTLVRTFLGGGIDTTVLVLSSLLHALATHPDQWALLRSDRSLIRPAFDEALRIAPAAPIIGRTTTQPTELGGVALGADEKLLCVVAAANRDPRRWDDPDRFDLSRNTAGQLGFGLGPHFCVGHATARLEADCLLSALLDRVAAIEMNGDSVPAVNNWLLGFQHLPMRLTPV